MTVLRTEQLDTLEVSVRERFVDSMVGHLRQNFPALPHGRAVAELAAAVGQAMAHAAATYGLTSEQDVAVYVELCATYCWQFDSAPEHRWMAQVLSDPAVTSPAGRLSLLLETCHACASRQAAAHALADAFGIVAPSGSMDAPPKTIAPAASGQPPGTTVQPCPGPPSSALEVVVCDTAGTPVAGVIVAIARGQGGEVRLKTGAGGTVRLGGLTPGTYWLGLPELDAGTWRTAGTDPLPDHENTEPEPAWTRQATARTGPLEHPVEEGDCVASLALAHGLLPETLWNLPSNARLHQHGRTQNILFPGNPHDPAEGGADTVVIPPVQQKSMIVSPGMRYRLCHRGLPEYLRLRFVDADGEARAGVPYLLTLEEQPGTPLLSVEGVTDADGRLVEAIPAGATLGTVTLCKGLSHRTIELGIGYLDPVSTIAGVQDRLANLGYGCGAEDGVIGDATLWALQRFQAAQGLRVSGTIDDDTRTALLRMHLG